MPTASWDDSPNDWDDATEETDLWDEDSSDTMACPACNAEIFDDTDLCPACGEFLIPETSAWSGKSFWWIALGILGIVALATALVVGF